MSSEELKPTDRALNTIWSLLYPGKTDWAYPTQVSNHVRLALEEKDARIKELERKLSALSK
jgi:hypothetical protein